MSLTKFHYEQCGESSWTIFEDPYGLIATAVTEDDARMIVDALNRGWTPQRKHLEPVDGSSPRA